MNIGILFSLKNHEIMLKLYLNENLSWRIARALQEYGYDVISSHEAGMNAEEDPHQFAFAVKQERAVVTNNFADFAALHDEYLANNTEHFGVIFTTKCPIPALIRRLRTLLGSVSGTQMMNQIRWLNEFE